MERASIWNEPDGEEARLSRRAATTTLLAGGFGLALAGVLPAACGRRARQGEVVIYASADDAIAREVLHACTIATGVRLARVFDTEATKTTGLENRIRAERNRPRADLFWSSEEFATARLAADGLLAALPDDVRAGFGPARITADGHALAFSVRARVVVWNPERLGPDAAVPRLWSDFADPSASGSIAIADPRFGTTRGHLAALDAAWRAARASDPSAPTLDGFLDGLRSRGVRVLTGGNAATVEAVATGECAFGFTDTDDALVAIERGLPIRMALPRSLPEGVAGGGTMLVPNTVGIVRGGPAGGGDEVRRVARWLASPECEVILCRSASRNAPLDPSAICKPPFAESDPLAFDLASAAAGAAELAMRAHARLAGAGDSRR
ncbi:MAG: extracellular solute-binding protein [Planctomycetota bacterium]